MADDPLQFDSARVTLGAASGLFVLAWLFQQVLEWASQVHPLLGTAAAIVLLIGAYTSLSKLGAHQLGWTRALGAVRFLGGLLAITLAAGTASLLIDQFDPQAYSAEVGFTLESFLKFYYYQFADLIPALEIPDTLNLVAPLQAHTFAAGLPVLGFKVFVLAYLFGTYRAWRKLRITLGRDESSDLLLLLVFLFVFVAIMLRPGG
jgi:hypothetical protein